MHLSAQSIAVVLLAGLLAACGQRDAPAEKKAATDVPAKQELPKASESAAVVNEAPAAAPRNGDSAACHTQDGRTIAVAQIRALGTEPFWNARIDGRCVTYSTPEDQAGTRIWTRYSADADGATWSGALDGRQFELRTRNAPGCSDGMSDNRYPLAATLRVRGETRQGCAEPA